MSPQLRRSVGIGFFAVWVLAVFAGLHALWAYGSQPGPAASAPGRWPGVTGLPAPDGRPVLVLALHPQCPCSRATLAELARLAARAAERPVVHALFVAPPSLEEAWVTSPLRRAAESIPGVHVRRDDGSEARRFGARVSGQALLYDGAGRLTFSGGITGARGHEGDNAGRSAIEAALAGQPHAPSTFVFGCLLFDGDGQPVPWEIPRS